MSWAFAIAFASWPASHIVITMPAIATKHTSARTVNLTRIRRIARPCSARVGIEPHSTEGICFVSFIESTLSAGSMASSGWPIESIGSRHPRQLCGRGPGVAGPLELALENLEGVALEGAVPHQHDPQRVQPRVEEELDGPLQHLARRLGDDERRVGHLVGCVAHTALPPACSSLRLMRSLRFAAHSRCMSLFTVIVAMNAGSLTVMVRTGFPFTVGCSQMKQSDPFPTVTFTFSSIAQSYQSGASSGVSFSARNRSPPSSRSISSWIRRLTRRV